MNSLPFAPQGAKDILSYQGEWDKPLNLPISCFSIYGIETITNAFVLFSKGKVYKALRQVLSNAFGECLKETTILDLHVDVPRCYISQPEVR